MEMRSAAPNPQFVAWLMRLADKAKRPHSICSSFLSEGARSDERSSCKNGRVYGKRT